MAETGLLVAYILAASLLTMTPGVDTALVLRQAASSGPVAAGMAALGVGLGCMLWGTAMALGLGALLTASQFAFTVLKWAGAGYLAWLGCNLVLRRRKDLPDRSKPAQGVPAFLQGFMTNILNPKVGLFYAAFLPQFVPAGENAPLWLILLTAIHVVIGLAWFAVLISATVPLTRWLNRPTVVRAMDRAIGGLFIGFAFKLVLTER